MDCQALKTHVEEVEGVLEKEKVEWSQKQATIEQQVAEVKVRAREGERCGVEVRTLARVWNVGVGGWAGAACLSAQTFRAGKAQTCGGSCVQLPREKVFMTAWRGLYCYSQFPWEP